MSTIRRLMSEPGPHRPEVERFRRELLDRLGVPIVIFGLVALAFGCWQAIKQGQWHFAMIYVAFYAAFFVTTVVLRERPTGVRSAVFLLAFFGLAVAGLLRTGLAGVGVTLLVAACTLTALLLGVRAALAAGAASALTMLGVGLAASLGLLPDLVDKHGLHASFSAWLSVGLTFVVVVFGLVVPFRGLHRRFEQSLDSLEEQAEALRLSNDDLTTAIARRQAAEAALRESEERYRSIFDTVSAAIAVVEARTTDDDFGPGAREVRVLSANRAAVELFRVDDEGELEAPLGELLAAAPLRDRPCDFEFEATSRSSRGDRLQLLVKGSVDSADGQALVSITDLTARKELEQRAAQSQKMEAIGTLAGGIAHDFNNLLMGILGSSTLLRSHLFGQGADQELLDHIDGMVRSGSQLTRQLLGFARSGQYDPRPTDLNELVRSSSRMFGRTRKELTISSNLAPDLRAAEVDRGQLEQVLLNLYVNAWQAMPGGGELTLETSNVELTAEETEANECKPGRYVRIRVTDTGVGMDAETLEHVFEPFYSTKDPAFGTGLGLASAYGIVTAHSGMISAQSCLGTGSCFDIHLPASDKPVSPAADEPAVAPTGSGTILLVEDEPDVLFVCRRMLEKLGYRVLPATDGAEAVATLEAHGGELDLVVLDMVMPGMSGSETFDRLRELRPDLPVLLSSGYSLGRDTLKVLQRGARGFLQKPFSHTELAGKVAEILAQRKH